MAQVLAGRKPLLRSPRKRKQRKGWQVGLMVVVIVVGIAAGTILLVLMKGFDKNILDSSLLLVEQQQEDLRSILKEFKTMRDTTVDAVTAGLTNIGMDNDNDNDNDEEDDTNDGVKKHKKNKKADWEIAFDKVMQDANRTLHKARAIRSSVTAATGSTTGTRGDAGGSTTTNIWDNSTILPDWLKEYFAWHKEQLQILHDTWKPKLILQRDNAASLLLWNQALDGSIHDHKHRFFIVRCFAFDRSCGGLADRLLPLPYLLQVAHNTSRILFIQFEKPAPLTSYMVPPRGGLDWRIPSWLLPALNFTGETRRYKGVTNLEWHASNPNETIVCSVLQTWHYGSQPYNEHRRGDTEPKFKYVVRDVWRTLFTPTLSLQQKLQQQLRDLQLREGHYTAVHLRLLYAMGADERSSEDTIRWTRNAINCASNLDHGPPYFVASDSHEAGRAAVEYGMEHSMPNNNNNQRMIVARLAATNNNNNTTPFHYDRIPVLKDDPEQKAAPYHASDYDETYVDLYLLAMAQCVSYGVGGYGKLASFLSYNSSCSNLHFKKRMMQSCLWLDHDVHDNNDNRDDNNNNLPLSMPSLLSPPMD
ncbi:expressed unknown protein [Seminavis robusta]|uniref:Uncharacterized protein n=1 Tax=Seminavis robusta TaxID=568900 RepID=A0A9N8F1G7_9STRA|nr:expressed unknown protein [Seminavis robusta]|eukprot:Sro3058_g342890.1 n/a (588) ;mRNA; f:3654-5417